MPILPPWPLRNFYTPLHQSKMPQLERYQVLVNIPDDNVRQILSKGGYQLRIGEIPHEADAQIAGQPVYRRDVKPLLAVEPFGNILPPFISSGADRYTVTFDDDPAVEDRKPAIRVEFSLDSLDLRKWWIGWKPLGEGSVLLSRQVSTNEPTDAEVHDLIPVESTFVYQLDTDENNNILEPKPYKPHYPWVQAGQIGFVTDFTVEPIVLEEDPNEPGGKPVASKERGEIWIPGAGYVLPPAIEDSRQVAIWFESKLHSVGRVQAADQGFQKYIRLSLDPTTEEPDDKIAWFNTSPKFPNLKFIEFDYKGDLGFIPYEDLMEGRVDENFVAPKTKGRMVQSQTSPAVANGTSKMNGGQIASNNDELPAAKEIPTKNTRMAVRGGRPKGSFPSRN